MRAASALIIPLILLAASASSPAASAGPPSLPAPPNVLVVVADDMGVDMLRCYGEGRDLPATPNVDLLAQHGLLFRNAWANPTCSPTRATLLTGRYGFRTGIGDVIDGLNTPLPLSEVTLPELLDANPWLGYRHACIGKWHLGNAANGGIHSPNAAGFGRFDGSLFGMFGNDPLAYYNWMKITDGVKSSCVKYNVTQNVDDALAWIHASPEPFFLYFAFSAPHIPYHAPPAGLYTTPLPPVAPDLAPRPFYKAMIEAMDTELGRLLNGLGSRTADTLVIFLGDNGTPPEVTVHPFDPEHAKRTLYEGGVNVPLIVAGAGVSAAGEECAALVNTTDVFRTVADVAGVTNFPAWTPLDSVSFRPYFASPRKASLRDHVFAEWFTPNGNGFDPENAVRAIRDARYKLIRKSRLGDIVGLKLFDLESDPFETDDLLLRRPVDPQAADIARELGERMDAILYAAKF